MRTITLGNIEASHGLLDKLLDINGSSHAAFNSLRAFETGLGSVVDVISQPAAVDYITARPNGLLKSSPFCGNVIAIAKPESIITVIT